ncbi:hypothetical protein [Cellulomonas xiejunii]|uniref:Imelysin-like domain-containing protein n=1 Tax=Cellulomonas xiejunii TaxID=2968083 RepID=A0ABY5KT59_9CELL|nr:hypothetical protein [Cellulomonas xiejunii]MCC2316194.1 hypothetical protein [Cellulomonas xiejunii]MCC2322107.1 hypothetical protein [Cellulomonas xiejunii]UUI73394.1 hypothetical protein NP048_08185 [Cellulomonas xiejunii]
MHGRGAAGALGGLAGLVLLVACSGPSEPAPAPASELDGMLDVILGMDADPTVQPAWVRQVEEETAACMHAAGFEYHPDEAAGTGGSVEPEGIGTVAFAERYGYGETIEVEEGQVPNLWHQPADSEGQRLNRAYVASLSPAAAAEYELALHGEPWDGEGEYVPKYVPSGCAALAGERGAPDGFVGPADLRDVKLAVRDMYEQVQSDPLVLDATARWAGCMEEAGYPGLSEPMDALSLVATRLLDEWQSRYADATGSSLGVTDYDVVRTRIPDALVELQSAETALAVADATCRDEVGYRTTRAEVETQLENEIADTYRDDLERWAAWAQEQRAQSAP